MKKFLFSFSLILVSAMVFANNTLEVKPILDDECTVSATIDFYGESVTITQTASTCGLAAAGVREGINNIKQYIF